MHTEAQIRRALRPLLDIHGELNTSEIKQLLDTVLVFDSEDIEPSGSRSEIKIMQRIGNIVSHQVNIVHQYPEGFIVDKSKSPAKFILVNKVFGMRISQEEIEDKKLRHKRFTARKVDWDRLRDRNNLVGDQGEEFALEQERDRVYEILGDIALTAVQHLSKMQGDGLGYDISSINDDGTTRYIEVKTTEGNESTAFYMSENEKRFLEEYREQAFIYRVYDFNIETRHGKIKIISSKELFEKYKFDPTTYKVTLK